MRRYTRTLAVSAAASVTALALAAPALYAACPAQDKTAPGAKTPTAAPPAASGITVTIDGEPIAFPIQAPVQAPDGTILVPLRGIFEKLGARVQFTNATRTVVAKRGNIEVMLRIGEAVGYVNDTPRTLAVPAQLLNGAALVPLRFVSEAFGAKVKWDAPNRQVRIAANVSGNAGPTVDPPTVTDNPKPVDPPKPADPPKPKTDPIAGTLAGVDPAAGTLVIHTVAGTDELVNLAPDAVVLVAVGSEAARRQSVAVLHVGDTISVRRDADGRGIVVEGSWDERVGILARIEAIDEPPARRLVFADGTTLDVSPTLPVVRREMPASLADVATGDRIAVRVNPTTKTPTALTVLGLDAIPGKLEVVRVTHSVAAKRWARAGEMIALNVTGTPGAVGYVRIPGFPGGENIALTETTPGAYTATIAVPENAYIKDGVALATLSMNGQNSATVASTDPLSVDGSAPSVSAMAPADGIATNDMRPNISAAYADTGSGIDAGSGTLTLNGADVSAQAVFTDSSMTFRPDADLAPGLYTIALGVKDVAGNPVRREWRFTVLAPILFKSLTVLPDNKPLDYGDILTVKVEGVPGAKATFAIGERVKSVTMTESSPGVYIGSYTLRREDAIASAAVIVTFTPPGGPAIVRTSEKPITLTAGAPDAPIIDLPQEGASVGASVVFSGRTLPNASVRLTVRYQGKRSGLINATGVVAELTVKADARGNWSSEPLVLKTPSKISGLTFTAEAVAIGTGDIASQPSTVRFKR